MFYVVYGENKSEVRHKVEALIKKAGKSGDSVERYSVDDLNFTADSFSNYIASSSLFGEAKDYIVICDGILEKKEVEAFFLEKLEEISNSKNLVFFIEKNLDKAFIEKIETKAKEIIQIGDTGKKQTKKEEFNIFQITDAVGARNRKNAWLLFQKALRAGITSEQILWKIFWQLKNMVLASSVKNASDIGMHSYVFQKANQHAKNYTRPEIINLSENLIKAYESDRSGKRELEFGVELILLSL